MTLTKGYSSLKVELTEMTANPFAQAWRQFRETWHTLHAKEYDADDSECKQAIVDILNRQALPIPMEDWHLEFRISGLSRVALAQHTRGRLGQNFCVMSQMPLAVQHEAVAPLNIATDARFAEEVEQLQAKSEALYNRMVAAGVPPEDCRYLILHGQTTSLVWHVNYAALQSYFSLRAENGLTSELNMVCRLARKAIIDYATANFATHGDWLQLTGRLDCMGAWQRKCLNVDLCFGNTGRFSSGSDRVPSPDKPDNQPDYDFRKSAFYLELIQLYETGQYDLLFEGEAEMLERWLAGGPLTED